MGMHSNYEQEYIFHYGMKICMLNAGMSSVTSSMSVNNEKLFISLIEDVIWSQILVYCYTVLL